MNEKEYAIGQEEKVKNDWKRRYGFDKEIYAKATMATKPTTFTKMVETLHDSGEITYKIDKSNLQENMYDSEYLFDFTVRDHELHQDDEKLEVSEINQIDQSDEITISDAELMKMIQENRDASFLEFLDVPFWEDPEFENSNLQIVNSRLEMKPDVVVDDHTQRFFDTFLKPLADKALAVYYKTDSSVVLEETQNDNYERAMSLMR